MEKRLDMATQDFGAKQKMCGSCMYWAGKREPIENNKKARCERESEPCLANKPQKKTPQSTCSKWVMWGLLKS